jgi:hypothetical protein
MATKSKRRYYNRHSYAIYAQCWNRVPYHIYFFLIMLLAARILLEIVSKLFEKTTHFQLLSRQHSLLAILQLLTDLPYLTKRVVSKAVLRIRIRRIRMFLGLLDPDSLV